MEQQSESPILQLLLDHRLVAILRLDDLRDAVPLARTLVQSGIRALEFTLTNEAAPDAIQDCLRLVPEFAAGYATIGLGSVRTLEEAKTAVECGAQFVVSPITQVDLIRYCRSKDRIVCPGAFTPTEIEFAWRSGANIVKVFPARGLGPDYIRDVLAPMPYVRLMPTGGIDLSNVENYFQAGAVAVGVGGQFVDKRAIVSKDWKSIGESASRFAKACSKVGNIVKGQ